MSVPNNRISLLYVDDEPALLDLARQFLELRDDFDLETAQSAAEALDILGRRAFDGVVSDYQMPETNGIGLLKSIRSRYPDLPFILFTGKGREEVVIQAFDAGADYYVQKGRDTRSQFRELSHKIRLAVEKRKTEKALRDGEERYRNVVEDQTEFICRFRPDGTHDFVNDAYCRYFGMPREEIVGHRFLPELPKDDAGTVRAHLASLTREDPVRTIEHRLVLPDGSIRWHQWTDRAIFDDAGTLAEYQSVGRDITDRKTAELGLQQKNEEVCAAYEQLAAIEEELRTSFDDLAASQRTLENRELSLNAILAESPISQFVIDRSHRILYWNHALAVSSGIAADEVVGTDQHWRAFYQDKRPCLADLVVDNALDKLPEWYLHKYEKSTLTDNAYEATDFFPGSGNGGRWLHFMAGVIRDRNGDIIGAVESLEDVTGRKTAELELVKKNEELHAAYEQLAAAEEELRQNYDELAKSQQELAASEEKLLKSERFQSSVISGAREGITAYDRDRACILWNRFMEDLTGIAAAEVLGKPATEVFPFLAEAGVDLLMEQALEGRTVESSAIPFRIDRTGREGCVKLICSPRSDPDGTVTGVIAIFQDIMERTVMEEALRTTIGQLMEGEEKYRNVFNAKNDPLLLVDTGTRAIIDLNTAASLLYGYPREEMLKMSLPDLSAEPKTTEDILARQVPLVRMRYHRKKDGTVFTADISSAYFTLKGRSILVLSVRDLSSVQQIADAVRLANIKLNLMIGITRHDVLNKLTPLIGYNGLMREKIADSDTLDMLDKQEKALSGIRSQIEFTRAYDDLGIKTPLWQNVCQTASRAYAQFVNTISFTCDTGSLEIYADPLLEKVFYNLFDNAFRHGEGISQIRISCKKEGADLHIVFRDDGVGIPAEDKERIFSRGFGKNTGLGLFITREILGLTLIGIRETGEYRHGARFEFRVPYSSYRFLK